MLAFQEYRDPIISRADLKTSGPITPPSATLKATGSCYLEQHTKLGSYFFGGFQTPLRLLTKPDYDY